MIVEINGVKLDVDMQTARTVDTYTVGMNVKVLVKEYSDSWKAYSGVITEFVNFKNKPTIVVAIFKDVYNGVDIEFIHINESTADNYELAPAGCHDLKLNKERAVDKFNGKIEKLQGELDDVKAKRDYFIKYFDRHFNEEGSVDENQTTIRA